MKNEEKKICNQCQKTFHLKRNVTWVFGDFCSRKCEYDQLVNWLNAQFQVQEKKIVVKKKTSS